MYITCQISRKICTVLTDNHIISPEENKFYLYCFDFILDNILFNASIFLIGVLLNVPLQSALYLITMIPVKMFAGGAHASSRMKCSMVSFSVFLMILFLTGQFAATTPQGMIHLIFFLSIFLILYMAPVGTRNKRIPAVQRGRYKQKCLLCCLFVIAIYAILQYYKCRESYFLVSICMMAVALNQAIGIMINAYGKQGGEPC